MGLRTKRPTSKNELNIATSLAQDSASLSTDASYADAKPKLVGQDGELIDSPEQTSIRSPLALGHQFDSVSLVQPHAKLEVSAPSDSSEQEADRIADQVVGQPQPKNENSRDERVSKLDESNRDFKHISSTRETPSQSSEVLVPSASMANSSLVAAAMASDGAPLSDASSSYMQPRFGHDFSRVRVHTNDAASRSAQALNANAYTVGNDIVFAPGKYAPGTRDGDQLLAHELTHVIQHRGGQPKNLNVSSMQSTYKDASKAHGQAVTVAPHFQVTGRPNLKIARDEADTAQAAAPAADGGTCLLPPEPINWNQVAPIPASPAAPWTSSPSYKADFTAPGNLDTYRVAFNSSWSEAQASFNKIYAFHDTIRGTDKEVAPILRVGENSRVGAQGAHANATDAFKDGALAPGVAKIDSSKVPEKVRDNILKIKDEINAARVDVQNKATAVLDTRDDVTKANGSLEAAKNNLTITKTEEELEKLHLDKNQVERDLEAYKADIDATTESTKAIMTGFEAYLNPTKIFDAFAGAADAAGKIGTSIAIHDANSKLAAIDGKISKLQGTKASLSATNASIAIKGAIIDVQKAQRAVRTAINNYEIAVTALDQKHRELATEMGQAGAASGMNAKDQQLLKAAVEVIPKVEYIIKYCDAMIGGMPIPPYNNDSGVGAAMAANYGEFHENLGIIKGTKDYVTQIKTTWEARLVSIKSTIDSATGIPSDW